MGNTCRACRRGRCKSVHPHGRGEHAHRDRDGDRNHGSSPRAWGTRIARRQEDIANRFIPTGVGNTGPARPCHRWSAVHPHGRGEHILRLVRHVDEHGSSPRAWGTRGEGPARDHDGRFIPTGVGNTRRSRPRAPSVSVHPHGRGEHLQQQSEEEQEHGSSPRAWGTLERGALVRQAQRFIPTGVGNTALASSTASRSTVHPHGRGEHIAQP